MKKYLLFSIIIAMFFLSSCGRVSSEPINVYSFIGHNISIEERVDSYEIEGVYSDDENTDSDGYHYKYRYSVISSDFAQNIFDEINEYVYDLIYQDDNGSLNNIEDLSRYVDVSIPRLDENIIVFRISSDINGDRENEILNFDVSRGEEIELNDVYENEGELKKQMLEIWINDNPNNFRKYQDEVTEIISDEAFTFELRYDGVYFDFDPMWFDDYNPIGYADVECTTDVLVPYQNGSKYDIHPERYVRWTRADSIELENGTFIEFPAYQDYELLFGRNTIKTQLEYVSDAYLVHNGDEDTLVLIETNSKNNYEWVEVYSITDDDLELIDERKYSIDKS